MALELRPNCERCDRDLPPGSTEAMICSYECTFCAACVAVLADVCPNCGGGFERRPIRPRGEYRPSTGLAHHPASTVRRSMHYDDAGVTALSAQLRDVPTAAR